MRVWVRGVGILGPGLEGWAKSAPVLRGDEPYSFRDLELPLPDILDGRERRRTSPSVRLALAVAKEAADSSGMPPGELAAIFGTSAGDGQVISRLLDDLTTAGRPISPTQFHNSVHNAAVGYWCIGTGSTKPSTSIAALDWTFPAALLKAASQAASEDVPVLLCVFDCPLPEPLHRVRRIEVPLGVALVLIPEPSDQSLAQLDISWQSGGPPQAEASANPEAIETTFRTNPAVLALPLLRSIAGGDPAVLSMDYPQHGSLRVAVSPLSAAPH